METQTRLSRHNKFISTENIIALLSVSSDDYLYASREDWHWITIKEWYAIKLNDQI